MKKWEYLELVGGWTDYRWKVKSIKGKQKKDWKKKVDMHDYLNKLGDEGWELVNAVPSENQYSAVVEIYFYFKKPKNKKGKK